MEIKLTVSAQIIAVLKLFVAEEDKKSYLYGINLEVGRNETRLVATNNKMLGCFRLVSEQPTIETPIKNIIIPANLLKHIKPAGAAVITIGELITSNLNARPITIAYDNILMSGESYNVYYPDFRRVIPKTTSGKFAQFDAKELSLLAKAWTILHGAKGIYNVHISHNGDAAALIDLGDEDFTGIIMPISRSVATKAPLSWVADEKL